MLSLLSDRALLGRGSIACAELEHAQSVPKCLQPHPGCPPLSHVSHPEALLVCAFTNLACSPEFHIL